ncbi:Protein YAE1 [Psilocybe cubensis]|uniref:Protein YAE1 n=2 Tax=Psilocybe cubensis TaxID=181762 RepID=A0ACB8GHN5_PSICU|nr:Protein YAE1 [Psilocybe cubensis]KAH9475225.1 Protein YAE1 [Psilocybe cubensis]
MDSPWDEDPMDTTSRDVEWSRISSDFTNVGYREGITAGKEAASQEGFNDGFANVGVPIGRELGLLRGVTSVLLSFLKVTPDVPEHDRMLAEVQDISSQLSKVRFSDIMPRDLEAEQHAREHLEAEGEELDVHEDLAAKRDMEGIEDMLASLSAGNGKIRGESARPTPEDVQALKSRLGILSNRLALDINWSC